MSTSSSERKDGADNISSGKRESAGKDTIADSFLVSASAESCGYGEIT